MCSGEQSIHNVFRARVWTEGLDFGSLLLSWVLITRCRSKSSIILKRPSFMALIYHAHSTRLPNEVLLSSSACRCLGRLLWVDLLAILVVSNTWWGSAITTAFTGADTIHISISCEGECSECAYRTIFPWIAQDTQYCNFKYILGTVYSG
jgi:hypothetical protein